MMVGDLYPGGGLFTGSDQSREGLSYLAVECGACTEKATPKLHLTAMLCHWSAHCGFWSLTG